MLWIEPQPLATVTDLHTALQNAIRVEHSTIPPYLTAWFTLQGTSPSVNYARRVLKSIVVEEMLHMTLACNILNAIGGHPVIADENFAPHYPSELPMGIAGGLKVHLRRFSKDLIENTFMKIEEPEAPLDIPTLPSPALVAGPITIGQFYAGIAALIVDHPELFDGHDDSLQVSGVFFGEDFAVSDVDSALAAIHLIVEQGEGTPESPLAGEQDFAHYYAFEQFSKGMRLVKAADGTVGFDPTKLITIDDDADVIAMVDDPSTVVYEPADSHAEELASTVDEVYSDMLRTLHDGFNGEPEKVESAVVSMKTGFREAVTELLSQQLTAGPLAGQFAGPRYRYAPLRP